MLSHNSAQKPKLFQSTNNAIKRYSNITIILILTVILGILPSPILAGPQSATYELKQYEFGGSGTDNAESSNYSLEGTLGEPDTGNAVSSTYQLNFGLNNALQANVPPAPTFTNPSSYYNKLKIVLNNGGNPSDTKFAIAISTDAFASNINYVQSDHTVGATLGAEDWQTYTNWNSATGFNIIGLSVSTTYTVKVAAVQGRYTQTGYGPTAQASTTNQSLSFDIDISATDAETSPSYSVSLGTLTASTVVTATDKIWVDLDTNADYGATVFIYNSNAGLLSSSASYTIQSSSTDLSGATEGYGTVKSSSTASSGGPINVVSPYNGTSDNVGVIDTTRRILFNTSNSSVTAGRASFLLKAKSSPTTPHAADYNDTLTLVATASF